MSGYPHFIPEFVLCTNSSLFWFRIANELSKFRNYLITNIWWLIDFIAFVRQKIRTIINDGSSITFLAIERAMT